MLRGGKIIMAKVFYPEHIARIQGKVCKKDPNGLTYMQRSDSGTSFVQHRHATEYTPTPGQQAANARFANAHAAVASVMTDASQLQQYSTAWKAQKKYATLRGFIFAQEYKKLG